jgi:predicted GH43/DUF377 family glycosyl hydrolase
MCAHEKRKRHLVVGIGTAVVVLGGTLSWSGEQDALPLSSWPYSRAIVLNPPTSRSNTVVEVVLSGEALGKPYRHINPDGSDLRFSGPDRKELLSYWIENWNPRGQSTVCVRVPGVGVGRIHLHHGNPRAPSLSDGSRVFDFFDDFNDGIWAKYPENPVLTRTAPWEARVICEPSVLQEDGLFKMWYMGCATGVGYNAALGYATSPNGFRWTKHAGNPILRDPKEAVIRTTVLKHQGSYFLFASNHQWTRDTGVINRWTSRDGLHWGDKTTILRPTEPWEKQLHNVGVIVDEGTWKMLYTTTDGPFGYAWSQDGLRWTKHRDPVLTGFYGGDPCLQKIGRRYYAWHSRAHGGHLRIYCSRSTDMIHWECPDARPQIGYTQPWERGIGRSEVLWDRHLSDAELLEHRGKVLMYYQGAQCPLGVATFDGTLAQLATRLDRPLLSRWAPSHHGSLEDRQLKLSDNASDAEPLHPHTARFADQEGYVVECRVRCYAGFQETPARREPPEGWATPTRCVGAKSNRAAVVMRYVDNNNFARFRLEDNCTTYYEERIGGVWSRPASIGDNGICDEGWHTWRIVVRGADNQLFLDGRYVGHHPSSQALLHRTDLGIGVSARNTFASFDDIRVARGDGSQHKLQLGPSR